MEEIAAGQDEREVLAFLVEHEEIAGAALGIARQVIDQGQESLSGPQRAVWRRHIAPYFTMKCERCGDEIPTSEVLVALTEGDRLCSWCRHMSNKDD